MGVNRPTGGETWLMEDCAVVYVFRVHDVCPCDHPECTHWVVEYEPMDHATGWTETMEDAEWNARAKERIEE